ncbi:hypothetical protein CLF_106728 [Clonorchis sinensis]|uniref:Uncharacterized protein n=1 Tax=Clonorchis sinensis TaxID=79923 RepID=G7YFL2_CLOSI|nr:hypothetical protein CLF_106728 [Clonorchis sinensis]
MRQHFDQMKNRQCQSHTVDLNGADDNSKRLTVALVDCVSGFPSNDDTILVASPIRKVISSFASSPGDYASAKIDEFIYHIDWFTYKHAGWVCSHPTLLWVLSALRTIFNVRKRNPRKYFDSQLIEAETQAIHQSELVICRKLCFESETPPPSDHGPRIDTQDRGFRQDSWDGFVLVVQQFPFACMEQAKKREGCLRRATDEMPVEMLCHDGFSNMASFSIDLFPLEYRRGDLILTYALFEQGLANRFSPLTQQTHVKLEGYPNTAVSELHVRKLPSCNVPSAQSVVGEYSELFAGDEYSFGFCS